MDRDALKRSLKEQVEQSLEKALDAVERAPDGRWIAASEWQVREIFQKLMSECYQTMLQAKMDAASRHVGTFSPSRPQPVKEQGDSPYPRAHRRR